MTEHTSLPWHADGLYVTNREPPTVGPSIADCGKSPRIGRAEQVANAAYIVKACNAFPDLVKARSTFLGYLQAENGCKRTGATCRETCACELELQGLVEAWGDVVVKSPGGPDA